jgi:hypothetical protein
MGAAIVAVAMAFSGILLNWHRLVADFEGTLL